MLARVLGCGAGCSKPQVPCWFLKCELNFSMILRSFLQKEKERGTLCLLEYISEIQAWRVMNSCLEGTFDGLLMPSWTHLTEQVHLHDTHKPLNHSPCALHASESGWYHQRRLVHSLSQPEAGTHDLPAESCPACFFPAAVRGSRVMVPAWRLF